MQAKNLFLFLLILSLSCKKEDVTEMCDVQSTNSPNVLLIIADDMGIDACPNYPIGAIKPNMPHLENLMSSGITFDNAWSNPICAPTRATILTGKYGVHTGVLNVNDAGTISSDEKTLYQYIDENTNNRYVHGQFGKWHLSPGEANRPNEMGADHFAGMIGGGVQSYTNWGLTVNGSTSNSDEYVTTHLTNMAIDWINEQDKPWVCWMAYNAPHTPFHLPPDSMHTQGPLPSDQASIDANPFPYYMAMIESLDFEIGRLMAHIPEDELANTTIIFIGDNGSPGSVAQAPFENNNSKGSMKEGGIHVPLIVSGAGVNRSGAREAALVGSVDLFSTISNLCGVNIDSYENSVSFAPLLSNEIIHSRNYNYSEVLNIDNQNMSGYTIRNQNYKLINRDNGSFRFYNLVEDPFEENNITMGMMTDEEEVIFNELNDAADEIRE